MAAQRGADVVEASSQRAKETEGVSARLSEASCASATRAEEIAESINDQRRRIEEVALSISSAAEA
ncbi:MAG: hypothetical protein HZB46_14875, partial [Solirubrobacterales bacterium]|nr:hypothetical protein [Solirubrobacterales bacterium]